MAHEAQRFAFESELNQQKSGLQFHIAALGDRFTASAMPRGVTILLAPTLGGTDELTPWLKEMVQAAARTARIVTVADLQPGLARFGAPQKFHRILLSGHQTAFARSLVQQDADSLARESLSESMDPSRAHLPMSHLEVLGTINAIKSDPEVVATILQASRTRSGKALVQLPRAASQAVRNLTRLGRFAMDELNVRYIMLSHIDHQADCGDIARYPHRVQMTCAIIDLRSGLFEVFARSQTQTAYTHAPPYILLGTMMRQLFESRGKGLPLH